jgi:predicted nucleic acid-binding protein
LSLAYFDASALLKLFLAEPGSAAARQAWRAAPTVASGRLLYAEARSALAAATRDRGRRFTSAEHHRARTDLDQAWQRMVKVEATEAIVQAAGDLAESYALRGYDAVHLASAIHASADAVVCADLSLIRAARACGLGVIDTRS